MPTMPTMPTMPAMPKMPIPVEKRSELQLPSQLPKEKKEENEENEIDIKEIVDLQNPNGCWSKVQLVEKLSTFPLKVKEMMKSFFVEVVLTYLASLWISKYYPQKQYTLVLKKARDWLDKKVKEEKIDESKLEELRNWI